jgi:hypothetical protein
MMIRIPFTKWYVSWYLPVLLVVFMLMASSWERGLLAFAAILGVTWGLRYGVWWLFMVCVEGKKRRPGENWRELSARVANEQALQSSRTQQDRFLDWTKYSYVLLDCGHLVFTKFPDGEPREGDTFYCWGHHKFGPTQEQTVVEVCFVPPPGKKQKILR